MKAYLYAGLVAALIGLGWWLRWDAVRDYKAKLSEAAHEHALAIEASKREHNETKRKLADETRQRLAAIQALGVGRDACYRLDDPLPDSARRLLDRR